MERLFLPLFLEKKGLPWNTLMEPSAPFLRVKLTAMLSQAPLLCALDASLQHLSRPDPWVPPRGASGEQFFGKLDREWLWRSVCLSLAKKGHRKTFAKNKLFGRTLSTLWPGLFSEGAPSAGGRGRGWGVSQQQDQQPQPWGPTATFPSPHQAAPSFPGAQVHFSSLETAGAGELVLGKASGILPCSLLPVFLLLSRAPEQALASLLSAGLSVDPPTRLLGPSCPAFAQAVPWAWNVLFSLPFPLADSPSPCEAQLPHHLLGNLPWPPGG